MQINSDIEIVNKIKSGNIQPFKDIVEKHKRMIFTTCMGFVHNKVDAEDLTQDVFISAYKSINKFNCNSSLSTWLYRIAVNTSLTFLRKNKIKYEELESISSNQLSSFLENSNPEKILIELEKRKEITEALNKLPNNQKTVVVLLKYNELSQKECAEILGKSEGAIEALYQRAKENLKKILN